MYTRLAGVCLSTCLDKHKGVRMREKSFTQMRPDYSGVCQGFLFGVLLSYISVRMGQQSAFAPLTLLKLPCSMHCSPSCIHSSSLQENIHYCFVFPFQLLAVLEHADWLLSLKVSKAFFLILSLSHFCITQPAALKKA